MEEKERREARRTEEQLRRAEEERVAKMMRIFRGKEVHVRPPVDKEKFARRDDAERIMSGWTRGGRCGEDEGGHAA